MKTSTLSIFLSVIILLHITSCDITPSKDKDSFTSGKLKIGVDDSYSLMAESQIYTYTSLNKFAEIEANYKPEGDIVRDLLSDSIQAAIISRPLNEEELNYFKSINRSPESILIAVDGVALVVHPGNADSTITVDQLGGILSGRDSVWKQIHPKSGLGKIQLVFDNLRSCNSRTLSEKFGLESFSANCFAVHSSEEVINYVHTHPEAIGVISLSWISDQEDPTSKAYASKVKTLGLIDPANKEKPEMARKPYQAYVYDRTYPLWREVYYVRTGLYGSLGTGFANHLRGDKGQLIIHKMGMVAATSPTRIIKVTQ